MRDTKGWKIVKRIIFVFLFIFYFQYSAFADTKLISIVKINILNSLEVLENGVINYNNIDDRIDNFKTYYRLIYYPDHVLAVKNGTMEGYIVVPNEEIFLNELLYNYFIYSELIKSTNSDVNENKAHVAIKDRIQKYISLLLNYCEIQLAINRENIYASNSNEVTDSNLAYRRKYAFIHNNQIFVSQNFSKIPTANIDDNKISYTNEIGIANDFCEYDINVNLYNLVLEYSAKYGFSSNGRNKISIPDDIITKRKEYGEKLMEGFKRNLYKKSK